MASLDTQTLLSSLQAVREQVWKYEALIDSDTVQDIEDYEELLYMYKDALNVLSGHYQTALDEGEDLPSLQEVLTPGKGHKPADISKI